jgi:CHAT domain-containing protein
MSEVTRGNEVLAVAPAYPAASSAALLATRGGYYALPFAQKEAQFVVDRYGGKLLKAADATRKAFLQEIQRYPILHLAMHARMDSLDYEQSALIFSRDEALRFHELYNLSIKPQLVVLSACNTGMGKLEQGEGFMSISRALTYAGAPSLIYSLWEVPDEETAFIMERFYAHLADGESKDIALQHAKEEFLAQHPLKQHPYFWAGFVLNGNTLPLQSRFSQQPWAWIAGTVGILGILLLTYRRFRQRGKADSSLAA